MFVGSAASTLGNAYEVPVSARAAEEENALVAPLKEGSNRAAPGYEYMSTTPATYDLRPKALNMGAAGEPHEYSYVAPPRQTPSDDGYIEPDWDSGDAVEYMEPTRPTLLGEAPTYMAMDRGSSTMVPSAKIFPSPEQGIASDAGSYMAPLTMPAPPARGQRGQSGKYDREARRLPQQGAYDIEPRHLPQQGTYDTQAAGSHYAFQPAQLSIATRGATNVTPQVTATRPGQSAVSAHGDSYNRLHLAADGPQHGYNLLAQPGMPTNGSQAYTALLPGHDTRRLVAAEQRRISSVDHGSRGEPAWSAMAIDVDARDESVEA
jgi:hypothetical protein